MSCKVDPLSNTHALDLTVDSVYWNRAYIENSEAGVAFIMVAGTKQELRRPIKLLRWLVCFRTPQTLITSARFLRTCAKSF